MRYYDESEYEPKNTKAKKLKHSRNRPGQGMRVLNNFAEDEYYLDLADEVDVDDASMYNTKTNRKQ